MFTSLASMGRGLGRFASELTAQWTGWLLPLAVLGAWSLGRRYRRFALSTALLLVCDVLYATNYDIHDIGAYFLPAFLVIGLWIGLGIGHTAGWLLGRGRWIRLPVAVGLTALPLAVGALHWSEQDRSGLWLVEDYARNLLRHLDPESVIVTRQWDFFVSPALYLQLVDGERPDVVMVDQELLRRSWYFAQLERQAPWLLAQPFPELDAYLIELHRFEEALPYNPAVIQRRFIELIDALLQRGQQRGAAYVTFEVEAGIGRAWRRIPEGLAYRLVDSRSHRAPSWPDFRFRQSPDDYPRGPLAEQVAGAYARMWAQSAAVLLRAGRMEEAEEARARAQSWIRRPRAR
jgi:hypothetical protein